MNSAATFRGRQLSLSRITIKTYSIDGRQAVLHRFDSKHSTRCLSSLQRSAAVERVFLYLRKANYHTQIGNRVDDNTKYEWRRGIMFRIQFSMKPKPKPKPRVEKLRVSKTQWGFL